MNEFCQWNVLPNQLFSVCMIFAKTFFSLYAYVLPNLSCGRNIFLFLLRGSPFVPLCFGSKFSLQNSFCLFFVLLLHFPCERKRRADIYTIIYIHSFTHWHFNSRGFLCTAGLVRNQQIASHIWGFHIVKGILNMGVNVYFFFFMGMVPGIPWHQGMLPLCSSKKTILFGATFWICKTSTSLLTDLLLCICHYISPKDMIFLFCKSFVCGVWWHLFHLLMYHYVACSIEGLSANGPDNQPIARQCRKYVLCLFMLFLFFPHNCTLQAFLNLNGSKRGWGLI